MKISLIKFLDVLKKAIKNNQLSFTYKLTQFDIKNLKALYYEGLLFGFKVLKNGFYEIYPKNFYNVKILYKPNKVFYFRYNNLLKVKTNNKILFLSTSNGIKSHLWCIKNKVGGVLLFTIF